MVGCLAWVGVEEPLAQGEAGAPPQLDPPPLLEPVRPALFGPDDGVISVRAHCLLSLWEQGEGACPLSSEDEVSLHQGWGISHC